MAQQAKAVVVGTLVIGLLFSATLVAQSKNGFDLSATLIPASEIFQGGPPRDGIPAIDEPLFIEASEAQFLDGDDRVLGISRNGIAKAYPIAILNWHEIVNDRFANQPIVVSFCPLCGSGVAFSAIAAGAKRHFGVSGLLYNSDVLLYDHETESLWSQLLGQAISGPLKGAALNQIPMAHTSWTAWQQQHPESLVLSTETGYRRNYQRDPYAGYIDSDGLFFPVERRDPRYHPKEQVLGIELNGKFKAYPFSELARTGGEIKDKIEGQMVKIRYDRSHQTALAFDQNEQQLTSVIAFWFAWYAFHPNTAVFVAP